MADIFFPDGTKLSDLAPNTANLLAALTPTFSGWNTNPGTNAEIVQELSPASLTTCGQIAPYGTGRIRYNLGSSKRVMAHFYVGQLLGAYVMISASDDGVIIRQEAKNHITGGEYLSTSYMGKCQYIYFDIYNLDGVDVNTCCTIICRAYQL